MFVISLCLLFTVAVCLTQYISYRRLRKHVEEGLSYTAGTYRPKLAVILPCKGLDVGFAENVRKLLEQDYISNAPSEQADFEVIFAVASQSDPAFQALTELVAHSNNVKAQIVVAGINNQRAQKINNQLAALEKVSPDVEVLVFVDSDVVARADFLQQLVCRLEDPTIGATTGYRFYVPFKTDCPSLLRSLWNRMSAWELANPTLSFAWGGAMAVRRSVFETAEIAQAWAKAADDDLSLTAAVKKLGLKVYFVPQCLVASHGDTTFTEFAEWMNRQMILTKVYYPPLWRKAIVRAVVLLFWLIFVCLLVTGGILLPSSNLLWASLAALLILPFELCLILSAQRLWRLVLSDWDANLSSSLLATCLSVPLAHIILPFMTLYSLFTNEIKWRGVKYKLKSPTETVISS